ncbi:MAG: FkbM family methyltransferase, partial [Conexivisphaerales archaeon]
MILDDKSYVDLSPYRQYLESGFCEKEISQYIEKILKHGDVFVDVGVNSGYYSLLASSIVGDTGRVYAFEPHPQTFKRFVRNLKLNEISNVEAFSVALSSYDGAGILNVSKSSNGLNSMKTIPFITRDHS